MLTTAQLNWGDVPSWVGLSLTLLALIFAAAAAVYASRAYKIESERDRINSEVRTEQAFAARRAQAALISAWWGRGAAPDGRSGHAAGAFVRNASEAPVYQAHVTVIHPDGRIPALKIDLPVVPPSEIAAFHPISEGLRGAGDHRVRLTFTDSAGVRWMRDPYGRLLELQPNLVALMEPPLVRAFERFAEDFAATYGVTVSFRATDRSEELKALLATSDDHGDRADVVVCPHDWIGDLAGRGVIDPIDLSAEKRAAFEPTAMDAFTFEDRLYGIPSHMDTLALIRNTSLAPAAPATLDDMIEYGLMLVEQGRVAHGLTVGVGESGDPYQIWPFVTSAGGWLFGRKSNGQWDPGQLGIAAPETVGAFERIAQLGRRGHDILRPSIGTGEALDLFAHGKAAFTVGSSGIIKAIRAAGVPFEVTRIPPWRDGVAARPFSGTWGFAIVRGGANRDIARDLIGDYVARDDLVNEMSEMTGSPPVLKASTCSDDVIATYLQQCRESDPMPAFPEMSAVWRLLGTAEVQIINGEPVPAICERLAGEIGAQFAATMLVRQRQAPAKRSTV
jgi:arabinogalactan oligomer/maltooligosaccharide transport system substrate-binding protein